jgi:phage terminase small subunit
VANVKLTMKQDAFIKEYLLNGGNATQAAIKAGYSKDTAAEMGYENLSKPQIKESIEKHKKKADKAFIWSKEKKLQLLEKIALCATQEDVEKGMINMTAAIAALKEHSIMQGDNAPTQTESRIVIDESNLDW